MALTNPVTKLCSVGDQISSSKIPEEGISMPQRVGIKYIYIYIINGVSQSECAG